MKPLATCSECLFWEALTKTPESWGTCKYAFPPMPYWVEIPRYGAINGKHFGCPVWEGKKTAPPPVPSVPLCGA